MMATAFPVQALSRRRGNLLATSLLLFLSFVHLHRARAFAGSTSNTNSNSNSSGPTTLLTNKKVCISGGGPCGLFLATLLIQNDPTVQITILEKSERGGGRGGKGGSVNAFGIGLGTRLLHSLDAVPGLRQRVESVGAQIVGGSKIVSRTDLSEQMTQFLVEMDKKNKKNQQCNIRFGEGCADIDLEGKVIITTTGNQVPYDLLVGADGINSIVRKTLVKQRGLKEEHYLEPSQWKALRLPPQPDFDAGSFAPLNHPKLRAGRLLPRYPEGHILLAFWNDKDGKVNPGDFDTAEELKAFFTEALQQKDVDGTKKRNLGWKKLFGKKSNNAQDATVNSKRQNVIFDDEAVNLFLKTRPGRSHYMKVNRFHDDHSSVALIGDAAHGMSSLLGQGCATGLKCTGILVDELCNSNNIKPNNNSHLKDALRSYSKRAVGDAHAITELNHVAGTMMRAGPILKVFMVPFLMLQKLLGIGALFQQLFKVDVPYERILRQNWFLIPYTKVRWWFERVPFESKT